MNKLERIYSRRLKAAWMSAAVEPEVSQKWVAIGRDALLAFNKETYKQFGQMHGPMSLDEACQIIRTARRG